MILLFLLSSQFVLALYPFGSAGGHGPAKEPIFAAKDTKTVYATKDATNTHDGCGILYESEKKYVLSTEVQYLGQNKLYMYCYDTRVGKKRFKLKPGHKAQDGPWYFSCDGVGWAYEKDTTRDGKPDKYGVCTNKPHDDEPRTQPAANTEDRSNAREVGIEGMARILPAAGRRNIPVMPRLPAQRSQSFLRPQQPQRQPQRSASFAHDLSADEQLARRLQQEEAIAARSGRRVDVSADEQLARRLADMERQQARRGGQPQDALAADLAMAMALQELEGSTLNSRNRELQNQRSAIEEADALIARALAREEEMNAARETAALNGHTDLLADEVLARALHQGSIYGDNSDVGLGHYNQNIGGQSYGDPGAGSSYGHAHEPYQVRYQPEAGYGGGDFGSQVRSARPRQQHNIIDHEHDHIEADLDDPRYGTHGAGDQGQQRGDIDWGAIGSGLLSGLNTGSRYVVDWLAGPDSPTGRRTGAAVGAGQGQRSTSGSELGPYGDDPNDPNSPWLPRPQRARNV